MKVRCTKLIDTSGKVVQTSTWLTVGKVYHVLSIVVDVHGTVYLRLMDDCDGVGLFRLDQFEPVTSKIPKTWTVQFRGACLSLEPEVWSRPSFWDDFYNSDSEAHRTVKEEANTIIQDDP